METSKDTLLMAEDSKTRDAVLFDMMEHISNKIDKANEIEGRVDRCESNITCIGRIGVALTTIFSLFAAWFKFGQ